MYQLTNNPDIIRCVETGAFIPRGHYLWSTEWLENNTPLPVEPQRSLDELRADLLTAATAERWNRETGGITIGGVQVGTTLDDQNRMSGVLSAIQLGGLESVDFKAQSGWVQLTAPELQGIALAISAHVQACFTAERAHHEAIEQLQTQADVDAYDVLAGHRDPAWGMKAPLSHDGRGLSPAAPIMLPQRGLRQFILAEIGLRMSDPGQQRVMFRSDYGWASRFRHGAMLCRQRTSSLLYFVYILLELG